VQIGTINERHFPEPASSRSWSWSCPAGEELWTCAAFLQAATAGNLFVLQASLDSRMDVNIVGDDGSSALHCAARAGQSPAVRYLLEHGAYCEAKNHSYRSPLQESFLSGDLETVCLLLDSGAQLHDSAMTQHCLGQCGSIEILELCLKKPGISVTPDMLYGILSFASRAGKISVVSGLLSLSNSDVNHPDRTIDKQLRKTTSGTLMDLPHASFSWYCDKKRRRGFTPLHHAAAEGHLDIVQLLVGQGFDVHKDVQTLTPLRLAARGGHKSVVTFLLNQKAIEVERNKRYGLTSLHLAAKHGKVEVVRLLLSHIDFDVGRNNTYNDTTLHLAAGSGHLEVVTLLLKHPRNNSCSSNFHQLSPLQMAALRGYWDVAKVLMDHEEIQKPREGPVQVQHKSETHSVIMKRLLKHPDFRNVNLCQGWRQRRGQCEGLLHAAIRNESYECIEILLHHEEIDVNIAPDPNPPLIVAAALGRIDAAKLLLQHKDIDINKQDYQARTALQIAREKEHDDIVDLLLAHGAKDIDTVSLTSGDNPVIADNSTTVQPQLEQPIHHDFDEQSYSSLDEYMKDALDDDEEEM
jgi:ankyrin repeat protein